MPNAPATPPGKTTVTTATFAIDQRELWAAAARAGMDPVTAKAIADHCGLHEATLSRVLQGKRMAPVSMLAAFMASFPDDYPRIARPVLPDGRVKGINYGGRGGRTTTAD